MFFQKPLTVNGASITMHIMTDSHSNPYDNSSWPTENEGRQVLEQHVKWITGWNDNQWYYVGVCARLELRLQTPQGGSLTLGTVESPGIWGIEYDPHDEPSEAHLYQIFEEQKDELLAMLGELDIGINPIDWAGELMKAVGVASKEQSHG